ncbi:IS110 family transposase [Blautia schinkii]|nr:IS110 family transposase [Blautia schinkii]
MILGEIDDTHRSSTPDKLSAFVRLDPTVYQSENFQVKRTRMFKHNSCVVRYALINVTHNILKSYANFKHYYDINRA